VAESAEVLGAVELPPRERRVLWHRLRRRKLAMAAMAYLVVFYFCGLFAPVIAPHDYRDIVGKPLSSEGVLGIDDFGRDVLSRLLIGLRTSLLVALSAVTIVQRARRALAELRIERGGA